MLEPLNDRLIVTVIEDAEVTPGGVVLPEQAKEKPQRGTVIALGPKAAVEVGRAERTAHTGGGPPIGLTAAPPLTVGDTVIFSKYGGAEVTVEAVDYIVLRVNDVLARVALAE
jgi:chaperonin GroES